LLLDFLVTIEIFRKFLFIKVYKRNWSHIKMLPQKFGYKYDEKNVSFEIKTSGQLVRIL